MFENNYLFDFHIHTKYSPDSYSDPVKIIKMAKRRNLSGFAITDHNTIKGGLITKKMLGNDEELTVIVGSEIQTDKGEVIGLFLSEEIGTFNFHEVCDSIRDQDGVILLPHPYRNKLANPEDLINNVDIIESVNARNSKELNSKSINLARMFNYPVVAGSDAHIPYEVGQVKTLLPKDMFILEEDDIKSKITKNQLIIDGSESSFVPKTYSKVLGKYKKGGFNSLIKSSAKYLIR
ncbi:PHP domain-containing protein [Methanolobus sp. ZRKC5]|uniref:PHP domain-containing protein n=1 Tax=unclassified Methanolobus TaxID=2629569 RepID=UPI00313AB3B9